MLGRGTPDRCGRCLRASSWASVRNTPLAGPELRLLTNGGRRKRAPRRGVTIRGRARGSCLASRSRQAASGPHKLFPVAAGDGGRGLALKRETAPGEGTAAGRGRVATRAPEPRVSCEAPCRQKARRVAAAGSLHGNRGMRSRSSGFAAASRDAAPGRAVTERSRSSPRRAASGREHPTPTTGKLAKTGRAS